jgi:hypothetical protein
VTDVQNLAAREATDDAEFVYVKHKLFTYRVPVLDAEGNPVIAKSKRNIERAKFRTVHAQRFQAINLDDIPEDELARGEELGAFFTEDELRVLRGGAPAASNGSNGEESTEGTDEVPEELNFDDHDSLVLWIKTQKPTVDAVVAAAGDDPDNAEALLDAENEATGGQPRSSLVTRLKKIIEA